MNKELLEKWKAKKIEGLLYHQDVIDHRIQTMFYKKFYDVKSDIPNEVFQFAVDGIADLKTYEEAEVGRILWILKEANCDGRKDNWLMWNMRSYCRWSAGSKESKKTFDCINRSTAGILEYVRCGTEMNFDTLPHIKIEGDVPYYEIDGREISPTWEIAYLNVKKKWGKGSANQNEVNSWYDDEESKKILHDQINYINPDIIINCSSVPKLATYLAKENPYTKSDDAFPWILVNDRVIIDADHPCVGHGAANEESKKKYCNKIFTALKRATE